MNPSDILFQTASNLTGGIVNDLTTAMVAMVVISMVLMGFEYLKDMFESHINVSREARQDVEDYENYSKRRERNEKFKNTYSAEHDFVGPSPSKKPGMYYT